MSNKDHTIILGNNELEESRMRIILNKVMEHAKNGHEGCMNLEESCISMLKLEHHLGGLNVEY